MPQTPKTPPYKSKMIDVSLLLFDEKNPRFINALGDNPDEYKLIKYMLSHEDAKEIAEDISRLEYFHIDRPLWVWPVADGKFLVKEGNRRLTAVKALAEPDVYLNKDLGKLVLKELPCLVYSDEVALNDRVLRTHTTTEIRRWSRLAKANHIKNMYDQGISTEDGDAKVLLNLFWLYNEARKIGMGDKLEHLLEEKNKSAVLERFFAPKDLTKKYCGFILNKNGITLSDRSMFKKFLKSFIDYVNKNGTTAKQINKDNKEAFLRDDLNLIQDAKVDTSPTDQVNDDETKDTDSEESKKTTAKTSKSKPTKRASFKTRPDIKRKGIDPNIEKIVNELYDLTSDAFPNAKLAFARIVFENVLKYVVDKTPYRKSTSTGKEVMLIQSNILSKHKGTNKSGYTDVTGLKNTFAGLITEKAIEKSFTHLDLDKMNQVIHNYTHKTSPRDTTAQCDNLIPLLEFLLQDVEDLLSSLDKSKL